MHAFTPGAQPGAPSRAAFLFMRLAGERGGEGANLSICSRPRGLYKARVSDLLELAKIARELAAAFRQSPRRHGDRKRRRGHRVWSRGVHGHRPHYAARGRRLRVGFSALLCAFQLPLSLPPAPPQLLPSTLHPPPRGATARLRWILPGLGSRLLCAPCAIHPADTRASGDPGWTPEARKKRRRRTKPRRR